MRSKADVITEFVSLCSGTVDIALISPANSDSNHPDLSTLRRTQPLRRLSFTLKSLKQLFPYPDPLDGGHPLFSCITHLRILDWVCEWRTWSGLAQIPHLTHVSANSIGDEALRARPAGRQIRARCFLVSVARLLTINSTEDSGMHHPSGDPRLRAPRYTGRDSGNAAHRHRVRGAAAF
ncbi:hypothetical protein C8R45DRAFT_1090930 [Mycena sanguinolenta]|nr:hypothetical protein C8R45DRAFT_1090930 [Mycena sanguinolenta]